MRNEFIFKGKNPNAMWDLTLANRMRIHSNADALQPKFYSPPKFTWNGNWDLDHTPILVSDGTNNASNAQSAFGFARFLRGCLFDAKRTYDNIR